MPVFGEDPDVLYGQGRGGQAVFARNPDIDCAITAPSKAGEGYGTFVEAYSESAVSGPGGPSAVQGFIYNSQGEHMGVLGFIGQCFPVGGIGAPC